MKAALVGSPVIHSLSPAIWQAGYESLGLKKWTYDLIDTDEAGLAHHLRVGGYAGFSVTMPLKRVAARLVDRRVGRTAGAVNTVVFTDDGTDGYNTDVDGVAAGLRLVRPDGVGKVVILGAGGTAAAALLAAQSLHPSSIMLVARTAPAAHELIERTGHIAHFAPWTLAREEVDSADVVVNTTPKHAADELAAGWPGKPLVEVVYDPWPTAIARAAEAGGHPVANGLYVLAHQAVRQIELITGKRPDPGVLLAAVEKARAAR
ncbi:MAG TPA: shikimate dehydrogenase [Frankiaceae bacterium]|nr:shikimate dehydrogenase [Frankiaceae bacterium]